MTSGTADTAQEPVTGWQLRSLVTRSGQLEISLVRVTEAPLQPSQVLVRVEAAPINPSDLGLLLGPADMATARQAGTADLPVVTAAVPAERLPGVALRLDQSMPVGNEGAGVVVRAGASPEAQALLGRVVALRGGAMYAQYRTADLADVLLLPEGTLPAEAASSFVNPLTALGMVTTMRREGHTALVHTAAASNLGQMLNRICIAEQIPLVNIVRSAEQVALLRGIGATFVCDSTAPSFADDLAQALQATGATLVFDAIGGGRLVSDVLAAMEAVAVSKMDGYNRYGSSVLKQAYLYGNLDTGPTQLHRAFGFGWRVGGWLLWPFMQTLDAAGRQALHDRVVRELKTTFASHYTQVVSLRQALQLEVLHGYRRRATGSKVLINPSLDL